MTHPLMTLRKSVKRLVAAEIADSWKKDGTTERELTIARKRYEQAIGALDAYHLKLKAKP